MSCGKHCTHNHNHTNHIGEQRTGKEYRFNQEALDIMENMNDYEANYATKSLIKLKKENAERRKELTEETKALIGERLMLTTGAEPILKNQYQMCLNALKYAENEGTASKKDLRELETTMCNARSDYNNLVNQIYDCEHKINHLKTQLLHLKQKHEEQDYWIRFINDELTSEEIQENQELIEKEEQNADFWLQPQTKPKMMEIMVQWLITDMALSVVEKESGVVRFFKQLEHQKLTLLYDVFSRDELSYKLIIEKMKPYILERGKSIVELEENVKDPKLLSQRLLDFKDEIDTIVNVSFCGQIEF